MNNIRASVGCGNVAICYNNFSHTLLDVLELVEILLAKFGSNICATSTAAAGGFEVRQALA